MPLLSHQQRPHLAIAGAGYAGLSAYLALREEAQAGQITLSIVNQGDAHLMLPELPLFLAGEEGAAEIRVSLSRLVRPPARLILTRVHGVDPIGPALLCADPVGRLPVDGLIMALGAISDDFGVPGVREHAISIGRWDDALELRHRLLRQYRRRAHGRVVVVGGGFTGVEIAAELASVRGNRTRITLVAPSLLSAMPARVQTIAAHALEHLQVDVRRGRAQAVEAGCIVLTNGSRVEGDTIIWAAGVRGNPVAAHGLPTNRRGQAHVGHDLRASPRVYCAGDCAAVFDAASGKSVATTAQAAIAEGALAARNLLREWRDEPRAAFHDRSRGFLVSLGRGDATGALGQHVLQGRDVAVLKRLIETYHAFQTGGLRALGLRLKRGSEAPKVTGGQGTHGSPEREPVTAGSLVTAP